MNLDYTIYFPLLGTGVVKFKWNPSSLMRGGVVFCILLGRSRPRHNINDCLRHTFGYKVQSTNQGTVAFKLACTTFSHIATVFNGERLKDDTLWTIYPNFLTGVIPPSRSIVAFDKVRCTVLMNLGDVTTPRTLSSSTIVHPVALWTYRKNTIHCYPEQTLIHLILS